MSSVTSLRSDDFNFEKEEQMDLGAGEYYIGWHTNLDQRMKGLS